MPTVDEYNDVTKQIIKEETEQDENLHRERLEAYHRDTPVAKYRLEIQKNTTGPAPQQRILVATPTIGKVRMEWVQGRYGQIIPTNWGMVQFIQWMSGKVMLGYSTADAQNIICDELVKNNYEWLLLIEDDTIPPADAFVRFNQWMHREDVPIVSGLYYTRSHPAEPMIYRGRGNSYHTDWKPGDRVWADGVPTGMLLVHASVIKALWKDSPEYKIGDVTTRRVFATPEEQWFDEATGQFANKTGTSDLEFCTRIMEGDYLTKAGWGDFAKKHPKYPFLVDTRIFCRHINPDGQMFPF